MGFIEPSFDIIKPDVGPKINNIIANGSCTFPVFRAFSPNPTGLGSLTKMGIV